MKIITWKDFDNICETLISKIDTKKIRAIYGIPRGGLVVAVKISHLLNIPIIFNLYEYDNENILICDDICDTGHTLELYQNDYKILVLHKNINSSFRPDYFYKELDEWVLYPWETITTSKADYMEVNNE